MRNELAVYLYQPNHKLLNQFKKGAKGEKYFDEFITLINEDSESRYDKELLLSSFINEKNGERTFIKFMEKIREELVRFKRIEREIEEHEKIREEIKRIQKEFNEIEE